MSTEASSGPALLVDHADGVAIVTFNRPHKHNAMNPEMMVRLADAWSEIADDPGVKAAILTGAGERAFCAGGDLGSLAPLMSRAREPEDEWDERFLSEKRILNRSLLRDVTFPKPVIAAVNGFALAGGTEILLSTDIRLAVESATFGLTEVRRGLVPAGGSLARLTRQVGWAPAMEIVLLGEPISAERALQIGLVNWLVARAELMTRARSTAQHLVEAGPVALREAKLAMVQSSGLPLDQAFEIENRAAVTVLRTDDAKEGPRAFMEKRRPNYVGH